MTFNRLLTIFLETPPSRMLTTFEFGAKRPLSIHPWTTVAILFWQLPLESFSLKYNKMKKRNSCQNQSKSYLNMNQFVIVFSNSSHE